MMFLFFIAGLLFLPTIGAIAFAIWFLVEDFKVKRIRRKCEHTWTVVKTDGFWLFPAEAYDICYKCGKTESYKHLDD